MVDQYQYLFVGGILGELLALPFVASYFQDARAELAERGAQDVGILYPNSFQSAEDNARAILRDLAERVRRTPKKLVLFCHSKACLEVVLALAEDSDFFRAHVHKVFCVQAPFKGSSLTAAQPGVRRSRIVSGVFRTTARVWPGLRSLEKDHFTPFFERLARTRPDMVELMRETVISVRGTKSQRENVAWILKASHGLLWRSGSQTDGLLTLGDQELPGFSVPQVELEMDHSDLFTSRLISTEGRSFRTDALTKLLSLT